jgi:uncharacterized protein (TIGR02145 family)
MKYLPTFIFFIFFIFFTPLSIFGEGTKQLKPDTAYQCFLQIADGSIGGMCFASPACDDDHKLFVRVASASEKIYLGFNPTFLTFRIKKNGIVVFGPKTITISGQGYIKYNSQAIAGPNVLNAQGYNAIQFAPGSPGDYSIEFDGQQPVIGKFDITVIDTTIFPLAAIDGRLWSKDWFFTNGSISVPTNAFLGTQYIYSDDSIVTSIYFNHMFPDNFDVTANINGCFPPPVPFNISRKSRPGYFNYPQYKIFLCNPDVNQFPNGTPGAIQNGITVAPQCDGSVILSFSVNKPGVVKIEIEVNPAPGHQPEDVTLIDTVTTGVNSITWNGFNGLGNPVPSGNMVGINISYINGLTNVALYDVEKNIDGIIIQLVRPTGPPLAMYWDDILLANKGGFTQLVGCFSYLPSSGCHSWDGNYLGVGLGSENTVNSWWYTSSSYSYLGNFTVIRVPEQALNILGSLEPCLNSTELYTVQPDPLPGADPNRYNWVLVDASTGTILFDTMNIGTTINIDFSNYPPGQKWLKVRGNSTACGFGSFGPAPNGILINSIQPTQITNTANTFNICSGDQTDILLQGSIPSTSFNYTTTATSPLITGYFPDIINPIHQTLFNPGTEPDTVIYRVVPFATPCYGNAVDFYVIVNPYLPAGVSIVASSNPVCSGTAVIFSATPSNGGVTPHYQWNVNGTNSGTDSPTFTLIPNDNDVISCTLTSSQACVTGNPAQSNAITMSVNQSLPVSVSVSTASNTVCSGTSVSFSASPSNEGSAPGYQWKVNGTNAGINSPNFTYIPTDNDMVSCVLTSSEVCATGNPATSNAIIINVNSNLPVSVSVSASSNPVCSGTTVTYNATPTNGGITPTYLWKVNGIISGANSPTYSYIPNNNDVVTCLLSSSETCTLGSPATSNQAVMTVTPNLPVSISISTPSTSFCTGSPVTITATPANGGTIPAFQWKLNGVNFGTNNSALTYNPLSGDIIKCVLTSSDICVTGNPATSNTLTLIGTATLPVGITIMANPNPFCQGSQVSFTATPVNGGTNPSYQWKVNGANAGTGLPNFNYNPANNDLVHCEIISNLNCVTGNPAISSNIIMVEKLSPNVSFASCFDTVTTVNAKPYKLKGGIPYGGAYSGPGVDPITGIFTPTLAGSGLKTIDYTYTNVSLCSAFKTRTIFVQPTPTFVCGNTLTDIRDNKIYPTVLIGSQCWMASNLNYGTTVQSSNVQVDNCIWEKYCYNDLAGNCTSYGGLYQWNEMMKYDDSPSGQGLCPPGWHVPTENEWTTFFNFYLGVSLAGKPLQDTNITGFNALTSGVFYLNSSWSFKEFATLFWSSTPWNSTKGISHGLNVYNYSVSLYPSSRANAFPVRCLRD